MRDKVFLDTNILIYLYSEDEEAKRQIAKDMVTQHECHTSTQVLNEFCNVCTKKWRLPIESVQRALEEIAASCVISVVDLGVIIKALELHKKYGYSYYDCLVLSSAFSSNCKRLFSEDMTDGQCVEKSLTITNIFK